MITLRTHVDWSSYVQAALCAWAEVRSLARNSEATVAVTLWGKGGWRNRTKALLWQEIAGQRLRLRCGRKGGWRNKTKALSWQEIAGQRLRLRCGRKGGWRNGTKPLLWHMLHAVFASVIGLDQTHCAFFWELLGLETQTVNLIRFTGVNKEIGEGGETLFRRQ
jgi:hypothetical protein